MDAWSLTTYVALCITSVACMLTALSSSGLAVLLTIFLMIQPYASPLPAEHIPRFVYRNPRESNGGTARMRRVQSLQELDYAGQCRSAILPWRLPLEFLLSAHVSRPVSTYFKQGFTDSPVQDLSSHKEHCGQAWHVTVDASMHMLETRLQRGRRHNYPAPVSTLFSLLRDAAHAGLRTPE